MFRKKGVWIALLLAVAAGAAWYLGVFQNDDSTAEAASSTPMQTATVYRGDLVITATGVGEVIASETAVVSFPQGELEELLVQVGDTVSVGDLLARIDDSYAQQAVDSAELAVVNAQLALDAAQRDLDDLLAGTSAAQVQSAYADLLSANDDLARLQNGPTARELEDAELALSRAKNSLWSAQSSRDSVGGSLAPGQTSSQYESAQANVANAEIAVRQAEMALEELQEAPSDVEVAQAKARVALAQEAYDEAVAGASESDLAEADARVKMAKLDLEDASLALETAREDLANTTLTSPMAGTVMSISASVGETVTANDGITLADTARPQVQISLDEADMASIAVGYEVEIVLDALPDQVLTGKVIQVEPSIVSAGNVATVQALAEIAEVASGSPPNLLMGLSGTVDVVGGRADNALLLPVEALRELSPGDYSVFVVKGDDLELRTIEVGLMDYTTAEIVSGLDAGDVVSTGIVETN